MRRVPKSGRNGVFRAHEGNRSVLRPAWEAIYQAGFDKKCGFNLPNQTSLSLFLTNFFVVTSTIVATIAWR